MLVGKIISESSRNTVRVKSWLIGLEETGSPLRELVIKIADRFDNMNYLFNKPSNRLRDI